MVTEWPNASNPNLAQSILIAGLKLCAAAAYKLQKPMSPVQEPHALALHNTVKPVGAKLDTNVRGREIPSNVYNPIRITKQVLGAYFFNGEILLVALSLEA